MIKRSVGYCTNVECDEVFKGVFLMNHSSNVYYCGACRARGFVKDEIHSALNNSTVYGKVVVEYNFDIVESRYRDMAAVIDESIPQKDDRFNVYYLHSPLIKTEKRAIKVAEALLSFLFMNAFVPMQGVGPRSTRETIIDMSRRDKDFEEGLINLNLSIERAVARRAQVLARHAEEKEGTEGASL